jgi:hypothetical protein
LWNNERKVGSWGRIDQLLSRYGTLSISLVFVVLALAVILILMSFAGVQASLKQTSIVLTALFAILGIFFEVKDKATGTITLWGRTFLGLTLFSMACSLIAQSLESAAEQKRIQEVLGNIQRSIQTIDDPKFQLNLDIDCKVETYKGICEKVLASTPHHEGVGSYFVEDDLWRKVIEEKIRGSQINVVFFASKHADSEISKATCLDCLNTGDMRLEIDGYNNGNYDGLKIDMNYHPKDRHLSFDFTGTGRVFINNPRLMTIPDLNDASAILLDNNNVLSALKPTWLLILTKRGQAAALTDFEATSIRGRRYYWSHTISEPGKLQH